MKHFSTSFGTEVLEAGWELHSCVEFDENRKRMLYTQKCCQHPWSPWNIVRDLNNAPHLSKLLLSFQFSSFESLFCMAVSWGLRV